MVPGATGRSASAQVAGSVQIMVTHVDVTDATAETEILQRSREVPVVVDLWAPWCGPCRTLGPIIEKVVAETDGEVILAKVNVDENPKLGQMFQVQSIPAVHAVLDGRVIDSFLGAQGEDFVRAFVDRLRPSEEQKQIAALIAEGDEASLLRALELDPANERIIVTLAELYVAERRNEEALELLAKIPETGEVRRVAALARTGVTADRTGGGDGAATDDFDEKLEALLPLVSEDEKRQEFLDLLEVMGAQDPRTAEWRKRLTRALF